jgi:hypothetical protein
MSKQTSGFSRKKYPAFFSVNLFKSAECTFPTPDSEALRRMPASSRSFPGVGWWRLFRVCCRSPWEGRPQREGSDRGRVMLFVRKSVPF